MTTNSRPGRQSSVDCEAVFALALQRTHAAEPCVARSDAAHAVAAELLSRLGRVHPLPAQVPPT